MKYLMIDLFVRVLFYNQGKLELVSEHSLGVLIGWFIGYSV